MGNGQKAFHKIRELAEIALHILGSLGRASWLLRHDRGSVSCPAAKVNMFRSLSLGVCEKQAGYSPCSASTQMSYNELVMCVGGWLAPDGLWEEIEEKWEQRIDYENRISAKKDFPPISRYKAADCANLKNEFDPARGWSKDRQIRFVKKLVGIIGKKKLVGIGVGVSLKGYETAYPTLKAALRNMYRISMLHCLHLVGGAMSEHWPSERVTVFYDHGDFGGGAQSAFGAVKKPAYQYRDYFVTVAPRSWEDSIALQPADLIAYETFKSIRADIRTDESLVEENARKSLRALMGWDVPLVIHYFRSEIFRAIKHWRETGQIPPDLMRK
jgi:hypothetical protein